jgi:hypothetical protein
LLWLAEERVDRHVQRLRDGEERGYRRAGKAPLDLADEAGRNPHLAGQVGYAHGTLRSEGGQTAPDVTREIVAARRRAL